MLRRHKLPQFFLDGCEEKRYDRRKMGEISGFPFKKPLWSVHSFFISYWYDDPTESPWEE
jgi:hypothetical protein